MSQEKYIGMDVHQATVSVAVMDGSGKLLMECLLENPGGYDCRVRPRITGNSSRDLRGRHLGRLVA
jgi:hypothetical protein